MQFIRISKILWFLFLPVLIVYCLFTVFASARTSEIEALVEGNNAFALELYSKLKSIDGNLFFSPFSLSTALAMTYAGARGNTEAQMANILHLNLSPKGVHTAFQELINDLSVKAKKEQYQLILANSLWGQKGYGYKTEFLDLTERFYRARLKEVNFITETESARKQINAWMEEKTNYKIKDIIKPGIFNHRTRLVLTNAIYFKGLWSSRFNKENTQNAPFSLITGEKVDCPMMTQTASFKYWENDICQVLELPYFGGDQSLVIFLPIRLSGLRNLEESFTIQKLAKWLSNLHEQMVTVFLPRFNITSEFSLAKVFQSMGMSDAFSELADFSGINGRKDLFISEILHKAFWEVIEEGSEATAGTGVVMKGRSASISKMFRADHPFFFLIRDNQTGSIFFVGRVINPSE